MIHNMGRAFDREKCSYYNPSIKFGGPNPDEEKRGLTKSGIYFPNPGLAKLHHLKHEFLNKTIYRYFINQDFRL